MALGERPAVRLLASLGLLAAPPALANVSGNVELQSQTTRNQSEPGGASTQSTVLMESLRLHYAGLPLGPDVAVATAGGALSNVTGWQDQGRFHARVLSFDASVGLLPRRAVPLRLYARGTVDGGTGGVLASPGAGPSLLYGGSLSLEPGRLPGTRVDVSEGRSSRPGHADLSDVQRRLVASSYGTVARQRLALAVRVESDLRDGEGAVRARGATLDWSSTRHQTTFVASEVRRSVALLSGITSDRLASGTSDQRWSPALQTQLAGRLSEAGADGAHGTLGDARASVTWLPLRARHQLTLSGSASAGFTRTSAPGAEASGHTYGAGARAGYGRPLGPVTAGLGAGASLQTCACGFGSEGTTTQLDATASVALRPGGRRSGQVEYTLVRALAPLGRGGDRFENHARGTGRLGLGSASDLVLGLAYDDGFRELLDITTGRAASLHERAITGSLGASTRLRPVALSAEARHTRGSVVTEASPFVAGGATQVRAITSAQASASWSPRTGLGVLAQLLGSWAELSDAPALRTLGANLAVSWRLGRMTLSGQYQALRVQLGGASPSLQQSIRTVLSRPFEL